MTSKDLQNILSIFPGVEVKEYEDPDDRIEYMYQCCIYIYVIVDGIRVIVARKIFRNPRHEIMTREEAVDECCRDVMKIIIKTGIYQIAEDIKRRECESMSGKAINSLQERGYFRK